MQLRDILFSDLLLSEGSARLKGTGSSQKLLPVPAECLEETTALKDHIEQIMADKNAAVSVQVEFNGVRYRVAQLHDVRRGNVWFLRRLAEQVPPLEDLNVGDLYGSGKFSVVSQWLMAPEQTQGLVLVSGPQASGKTTLASAFVASRLSRYGGHGVTFENPPELPLAGDWGDGGSCYQVAINGEDELAQEVERAHRYGSPNILFIGEVRTKWAAREALRIALGSSRQIVVATIHGLNIVAALHRLINWARELDGQNALENLAISLLTVIQLSMEEHDGKPTVVIPECLLLPFTSMSHAARAKLRDGKFGTLETDSNEIFSYISEAVSRGNR